LNFPAEGRVVSVGRNPTHAFGKPPVECIRLLAGRGVEGDAHAGEEMQHRSRRARQPVPPNLRQVHLIHSELFEELRALGFELAPGQIGENITTRGLDLLGLPEGARLHLGGQAVISLTGLRNPCHQLEAFRPGLMQAVLARDAQGGLVRKAGVLAVVVTGGEVRAGDAIRVELPAAPHKSLEPI
jgi:MOSC domain-containing protein YiiM